MFNSLSVDFFFEEHFQCDHIFGFLLTSQINITKLSSSQWFSYIKVTECPALLLLVRHHSTAGAGLLLLLRLCRCGSRRALLRAWDFRQIWFAVILSCHWWCWRYFELRIIFRLSYNNLRFCNKLRGFLWYKLWMKSETISNESNTFFGALFGGGGNLNTPRDLDSTAAEPPAEEGLTGFSDREGTFPTVTALGPVRGLPFTWGCKNNFRFSLFSCDILVIKAL